jgi:hypothetical protein
MNTKDSTNFSKEYKILIRASVSVAIETKKLCKMN